jgi:hypothetical protein
MAAKTTSGSAPSRADSAHPDLAGVRDAFADEHSDVSETPAVGGGREQAHVHARCHRRWLRARTNPEGDHDIELRAQTSPEANQRAVSSAPENGRRP